MTVPVSTAVHEFIGHLVDHLDEQLRSVVRLREALDALGVAIRDRDVTAVLRHTGTLEAETIFRATLEERRAVLLRRGAAAIGVEPAEVTVSALGAHVEPALGDAARERSDELLRATEEVARKHRTNQALMQQELSFLEHLLRLGGVPSEPTYEPPGDLRRTGGPRPAARHGLDLRA